MGDGGPSALQSGHVALRFPCVWSTEETHERKALQLGRRTQVYYEGLGLVTATRILGTKGTLRFVHQWDRCAQLKRRTINDITEKMREDETMFYRFLKARQFNVKNAESMLRKNIAFRKEYQVDTILTDYKIPESIAIRIHVHHCVDENMLLEPRIFHWVELECKVTVIV
ncbi:SEC14-like protein 2 [Trichonephila clavipes]|nr:SEC14-like protein 2 [Trichonephila clavipes]